MGCCFYDLCSPRRKIYGKQSAGDQSQSPWFNKHSLISRHQGQTREGAVEGSHRKPAARQEVVEGAEGRGGQLVLSQPPSLRPCPWECQFADLKVVSRLLNHQYLSYG